LLKKIDEAIKMGKIVKFCSSCEESFAEKFSFCPNCASELSAFEMKPLVEEIPAEVKEDLELKNEIADNSPIVLDVPDLNEESIIEDPSETLEEQAVFEPVSFTEEPTEELQGSFETISDNVLEIEVEEPQVDEEVYVADIPAEENYITDNTDETIDSGKGIMATRFSTIATDGTKEIIYGDKGDDGFHVTVVSEKGGSVRNGLLLLSFALIMFGFGGVMLYSLFFNLDNVGSIGDDKFLVAMLEESEPMQTEEEEKKENDDEGGGGGGGGKENPKPVTRGELPTQTRTLQPPPQMVPRLTNPDLKIINTTQGDIKRERTTNIGIPDGIGTDPSSGSGSGGGIGTGKGTGVGSGFGTGEGSGTGSGSGSGNGDGTGSGTGSGRGTSGPPPPPPPPPSGPTTAIKILAKPKPGYTDEARQNNVRGVVRVRVAFLANGRIGGVSVVKGLPHGLTEKAIAAARQIRFEPPQRNGVPYSVNKVVQFSFTIY
jgi:TonB family protein